MTNAHDPRAQNKKSVRRVFEELLSGGDVALAEQLIAAGYVNHEDPQEARGPEAMRRTARYLRNAFPDLAISVQDIVAEGDTVVAWTTLTGTQRGAFMGVAPTNRRVVQTQVHAIRVIEGKAVEHRALRDDLGLLRQLEARGAPATMGHDGAPHPNGAPVSDEPRQPEATTRGQDMVTVVQDAYAAFGRGDFPAVLGIMADDIEWVILGPSDLPWKGTRHGKSAVGQWFGVLYQHVDQRVFAPQTFIAQHDTVVVLVHTESTMRRSGQRIVNPEAHVWTFRDGAVVRFQIFDGTAAIADAYRGTVLD